MDHRRFTAHSERNREPIRDVLARFLPGTGALLEIASGSGEHAVFFAAAFPGLQFHPSDIDPDALASIEAWREHAALPNLMPARRLDVRSDADWPKPLDVVFNANMIHISAPETLHGLLRGASRSLVPGGLLVLYGPFKVGGVHTGPSNAAFDERLQRENPEWGVRDLETVSAEAGAFELELLERVPMPANNFCLVFRRA